MASAYLKAHPDDVTGVLFVDAMFPDELGLDRYLPRQHTFKHFDKEDKCCTLERISQFDLIRSLQPTIGREPDIPAIYLAAKWQPRTVNDYGSPAYDARILDVQAAFVDRFSPGILRWVEAPPSWCPWCPTSSPTRSARSADLASAGDRAGANIHCRQRHTPADRQHVRPGATSRIAAEWCVSTDADRRRNDADLGSVARSCRSAC